MSSFSAPYNYDPREKLTQSVAFIVHTIGEILHFIAWKKTVDRMVEFTRAIGKTALGRRFRLCDTHSKVEKSKEDPGLPPCIIISALAGNKRRVKYGMAAPLYWACKSP